MADVVTSQIYDGAHNVVLILSSNSDGTGETLVRKLDVSTLKPNPLSTLRLWRGTWDITSPGEVILFWEGTPNRPMIQASSASTNFNYGQFGGLKNDALAPTGNVLLSSAGFAAASGYHLLLEFKKGRN